MIKYISDYLEKVFEKHARENKWTYKNTQNSLSEGKGQKDCEECDGSGYTTCTECYGDIEIECSKCCGYNGDN